MKSVFTHMTAMLLFVALVIPVVTDAQSQELNAQGIDVEQQVTNITNTYSAFIQSYIGLFANNPEVARSLNTLLIQLNGLRAVTDGGSGIYKINPVATPPSQVGVSVIKPGYQIFADEAFGRESTINKIIVQPGINGGAYTIWESDADERIVSTITMESKKDDNDSTDTFLARYRYTKDGKALRSDEGGENTRQDLAGFFNDYVDGTSSQGKGSAFVEFLLYNTRQYSNEDREYTIANCNRRDDMDFATEIIEDIMIGDNRTYVEPIESIIEFRSPNVSTDSVTGCVTNLDGDGSQMPYPDLHTPEPTS